MPYTWLGFSTASTEFVAESLSGDLFSRIEELIRSRDLGGSLDQLYFDVGQEVAYALFKDLGKGDDADGSVAVKTLSRELGGVEYKKLLSHEQVGGLYAEGVSS